MLAVKDATVLIHLAKISLLEKSCVHFKKVIIPKLVYKEVRKGIEKGYADAVVVVDAVKRKLISIKKARGRLVRKCNSFSIYGGEAEAVALYWQEKASILATDDDNVRKKAAIISVNVAGTPAILLKLVEKGYISKEKFKESVSELRKVGWFSDAVLDKALMEGLK
ncbi:MAG TPA: hypothetical protein VI934_04315 [Candidatus Nanoarchaeia archaeon]|nr:hypothetical protein [Candidatus Nanoarchaeia archaeon]